MPPAAVKITGFNEALLELLTEPLAPLEED
jgi:hypothetical protein